MSDTEFALFLSDTEFALFMSDTEFALFLSVSVDNKVDTFKIGQLMTVTNNELLRKYIVFILYALQIYSIYFKYLMTVCVSE